MKKIILSLFVFCCFFDTLKAQPDTLNFYHPRGIVSAREVPALRQKVQKKPYSDYLNTIKHSARELAKHCQSPEASSYDLGYAALNYSCLYLCTGEKKYADSAYIFLQTVVHDSEIFNNLRAKGLSRGALLRNTAICYDFCFDQWSLDQQKLVAKKMFELLVSVNSSMGFSANYALESNWMGVRWGSVLLAAAVCDEFAPMPGQRPANLPYLWDSKARLFDHLKVSFRQNGWHVESLSYMGYDFFFSMPALRAFSRIVRKEKPGFGLKDVAPNALNSARTFATATVAIETLNGKGMKPDLSDDNAMTGNLIYPIALPLLPPQQAPYLKWMIQYTDPGKDYFDKWGISFLKIAYMPDTIEAQNPEKAGWLNFVDTEQGVTLFRNRFKDENDIVAAFTATAARPNGHQGYDNLTFRLIGLGSYWAIGAGRTGEIAGQTNLFPTGKLHKKTGEKRTGKLLDYGFRANGSGFAKAQGSCVRVGNHRRFFAVDFDESTGAQAFVVVADSSANGRRWRLNTPEFNRVSFQKNGFTLTAPHGATLRALVLSDSAPQIDTSRVRYGGSTVHNNPGIRYRGKRYDFNTAIDVLCQKNIVVAITLQPKGKKHPKIQYFREKNRIRCGKKTIQLK